MFPTNTIDFGPRQLYILHICPSRQSRLRLHGKVEVWVLQISQVIESVGIELLAVTSLQHVLAQLLGVGVGLFECHDRGVESRAYSSKSLTSLFVLLVEATHLPSHGKGCAQEDSPATDIDFDTEVVVRFVLWSVNEWPSDLVRRGWQLVVVAGPRGDRLTLPTHEATNMIAVVTLCLVLPAWLMVAHA